MASADATATVARWCRVVRSLDAGVTAAYLKAELAKRPVAEASAALDALCDAVEQGHAGARTLLVALVDLLAAGGLPGGADALQREAARGSLVALARLLRPGSAARDAPTPTASGARVPDYTAGAGARPLTLGERKSLARRPTRAALAKLLADPHPAVVRALLANPTLVEDDVVRLAARRPAIPEVLTEVARTARWAHRVRVRMALVLNPDTPLVVAAPFLALLTRPELRQVLEAVYLGDDLRTAASALLARRLPARTGGTSGAGGPR